MSKLRDINERKNTLVTQSFVLSDAISRPQIWRLEIKFLENYFFLKNYVIPSLQREPFLNNLSPLFVTK